MDSDMDFIQHYEPEAFDFPQAVYVPNKVEETPEQAKQVVFWDRYDYQSKVEQQSLIFLLRL